MKRLFIVLMFISLAPLARALNWQDGGGGDVTGTGASGRLTLWNGNSDLTSLSGLSYSGASLGINLGGAPGERLHIGQGNIFLDSNVEQQFGMRNTGITNNPYFKWGRMIVGGDGHNNFRFMYSDDVTVERAIIAFDDKGTFASVAASSNTGVSQFEAWRMNGETFPWMRINRASGATFELGVGGSSDTDWFLRRTSAGVSKVIGQLGFTDNSLYGILGTATNDNALAGNYGEFASTTSTTFANIATSGQFGNVVSTTLTAGDWDVGGCVTFKQNGATITDFEMAISSFSANTTTDHTEGYNWLESGGFPIATANSTLCVPRYRATLSGSTTIYLKIKGAYAAATPQALGTLTARRAR